MPSPRDWFRRRSASGGAVSRDPFAAEGVLDLGRSVMLRESTSLAVPPPTQRAAQGGRLIHASAFTVRPEIARRDRARVADAPPPAEPVAVVLPPAPPRAAAPERHAAAFRAPERRPLPPPAPAPAPVSAPRTARDAERTAAEAAAFTLAAPGPSWLRGKPGHPDASRVNALLRDAFTPTRPKHDAALFSGRFREMQRIIAAIEEERAHVVVYGERGSGKTSLCNILAGKASEAGYFVLQFACSSGVGFEDIFRNFLRRIPVTFLSEGMGSGSRIRADNFAQLLPEGSFGVAELIEVFARLHERHVILVVDEYDRVVSEEVKSKLAELLKIMSDANVPVSMLLIGVADDVRELFGKHPSLQRTLVTVPMPLMSRREIEGLIAGGEARANLAFAPEVRDAIVDFAQGLPYHAQLLCLLSARSAARRGSQRVEREDLRYAVERAAEEAESRIKDAYELAVGAPPEPVLQDALFHAARAQSDEFGSFAAPDVAAAAGAGGGEAALLALQVPLKTLTETGRGGVLRRNVTANGVRYQFCSQMFRHYVLVRQAAQHRLV